MMGRVLRHDEGLHRTIKDGAFEGRKPPGRSRNSYIPQLKKYAGIDTYAGLKRLNEDRKKWREKLNTL